MSNNMRPSEKLRANLDEVRRLAAECGVQQIRIFGSVARNEDTESSDLDVLAIHNSEATIFDHAAFAHGLNELLDIPCDVLSDEILSQSAFADMMEKSISLEDFERQAFTVLGDVPQEKRDAAAADNLGWIIERISRCVCGITYEDFLKDSMRYDALAYDFQLLGSIVSNTDSKLVAKYSKRYQVDLSGCSLLTEMLMTTMYPRMIYQTAKKLQNLCKEDSNE